MNSIKGDFSNKNIGKWFRTKGFEKIDFKNEKHFVSTLWIDQSIAFKLIKLEGFDTFIKSAYGGSILVFECKIESDKIIYHSYSPIWLFGIWTKKLKFKKKASYFFKYLSEGYKVKEEFEDYLMTE